MWEVIISFGDNMQIAITDFGIEGNSVIQTSRKHRTACLDTQWKLGQLSRLDLLWAASRGETMFIGWKGDAVKFKLL